MAYRVDPKMSQTNIGFAAEEISELPIYSPELPVCIQEEENSKGAVDNTTDAFFNIAAIDGTESPFDAFPVDPEFLTDTNVSGEDLARYEDAANDYLQVLDSEDPNDSVDAFQSLLASAVLLSGLDKDARQLLEAEALRDKLVAKKDLAVEEWQSQRRASALMSAKAEGWFSAAAPAVEKPGSIDELEGQIEEAESVIAKVRLKREASATLFEALVKDVVAASMPHVPAGEAAVAPFAMSMMAKVLAAAGEVGRAQEYYDSASLSAGTVAQSAWFRMESLHLEAMKGGKAAAEALPKIRLIREGLSQLAWQASMSEVGFGPSDVLVGGSSGAEVQMPNPGRPEDVHALDAFSWSVHYEVLQASLAEPGAKTKAVENRLGEILQLEEERRATLAARKEQAGVFEAQLHLTNMHMVAASWTYSGGNLERALRDEGAERAASLHAQLEKDLVDAVEMGKRFVGDGENDPFLEKLASIEWNVRVDGLFSRDLPQEALRAASLALSQNPQNAGVISQAESLRQTARNSGVEEHIFLADGSINVDVDVSSLPVGKLASSRAESAYWSSPNTLREMGLPFAAASGCYGLALLTSWTGPGAFLVAGTCAVATIAGNQQYNTRVLGGEASRQASVTGLTRISEDDARRFRNVWLTNAGINTLFSTGWANMGAGLGRFLVGGMVATGKGTGSAIAHAIASAKAAKSAGSLIWGGTKATGRALQRMGSGMWNSMSAGDMIHAGASLGWPADYLFIDADGNYAPGDMKTDHWIGYVGKTAFWGGLAYRGFSCTWNDLTKEIVRKGGEKVILKGFAKQVAEKPWRGWISRAGVDMALADYYLINGKKKIDENEVEYKDIFDPEFLNFGMRRETDAQTRDFDRQFEIDTIVGYGGLLLAGGDWATQEFRTLPLYLDSTSQVFWARARMLAGTGMVGTDLGLDGELDTWWLGGIGGALLMNEAGSSLLQVDAMGSMVATGFRAGTEWIMQWQQDIPVTMPDAKRLMFASAESALMRFPAKAYMMGNHYMKTYPLGRRLISLHNKALASKYAIIRNGASFVRPIEAMGGKPVIEGWKHALAKADKHKTILLKRDAHGKPIYDGSGKAVLPEVSMKIISQKKYLTRSWWSGKRQGVTKVEIDGTVYELNSSFKNVEIKNLLKHNGYHITDGNLWKTEVWWRGEKRINGEKMTARRYEALNDADRVGKSELMKEQGVFYVEFENMSDKGVAVKGELAAMGAYNKGMKGALMKRWYKDPETPQILSSHEKYTGGPKSNCTYKIDNTPLREGFLAKWKGKGSDVWFKVDREMRPISEVDIGGETLVYFRGPFSKPRLTGRGTIIQGTLMSVTSYFATDYIFRHAMSGDPEYQPMQRFTNYGVSEFATHPLVQWRLGYDTALAQLAGRSIGIFVNMIGNEIFPTYLNSWPGLPMYQRSLDGSSKGTLTNAFMNTPVAYPTYSYWRDFFGFEPMKDEPMEALGTWTNTMKSTQFSPIQLSPKGEWGKSDDTLAHFEDRAINTFRLAEQCQSDIAKDGVLAAELENSYEKFAAKSCDKDQQEIYSDRDFNKIISSKVKSAMSKSEACKAMPDKSMEIVRKFSVEDWKQERDRKKTLESRVISLAENFESWIERERKEGLSIMERRALILMAAHIKSTLERVRDTEKELLPLYSAWEQLEERYSEALFSKIPPIKDERDWKDFARIVNRGRSQAEDFNFYVK